MPHDIGEMEVKHSVCLRLYNLYGEEAIGKMRQEAAATSAFSLW
jgi:hypothetical protein